MARARTRYSAPAWLLNLVIAVVVTVGATLWLVDSVRDDYEVPTEVTAAIVGTITLAFGGRLVTQRSEEERDDE